MLSFYHYKAFSKELKSIATSLWVSELMLRTKSRTIYELPIKLSSLEEDFRDGTSEQESKFWYKKYNGKPLRNDSQVRRVEQLLPKSSYIIYHPLWILLNLDTVALSELILTATELPPKICHRIVDETDGMYALKCPRKELAFENSLDAFTAAFILHLAYKIDREERSLHFLGDSSTSVELFKLFLRLFTIRHKFKFSGKLFKLLSPHFNESKNLANQFDLPGSIVPITNFPLSFGNLLEAKEVDHYLEVYKQVVNVISNRIGLTSVSQKMKFFSYVSHKHLNKLIEDTSKFKTIKLKTTEDFQAIPYLAASAILYQLDKKKIEDIHDLDYSYSNH